MPWTSSRVADTILREMELQRRRFGVKLKELRKARGWNQEDAAHEVGVGAKTWRLWEGGKTTPYDTNLKKIGAAFDVDPGTLMDPPSPLGLGLEPEVDLTQIRESQQRIETKLDRLLLILGDAGPVDDVVDGVTEEGLRAAEQLRQALRDAAPGATGDASPPRRSGGSGRGPRPAPAQRRSTS